MPEHELWQLPVSIAAFVVAAAVIGVAGTWLTTLADRLADRTGLGEAFLGTVGLGAVTALPGVTASVTAAIDGYPVLALSNAIGGIAVQTAFLAVADLCYRGANLEHAAASLPNMFSSALLIALLAMVAIAMVGPDLSWFGIHPMTPLLFVASFSGLAMIRRSRDKPMWRPRMTEQTLTDEPDEPEVKMRSNVRMFAWFGGAAVLVIASGWTLTRASESIATHTGLSDSAVGALLLAVVTSLPELVTSIAAVRRGALTLAVGGIVGGNAFDTLFAAAADIAYRPGSIYHAATPHELTVVMVTILMMAVLLMGLLRRQRHGIGNIGFESVLMLLIYAAMVASIFIPHGG